MKHPWVWVIWLAAVLVLLSIIRNPLYLLIVLLSVLFVSIALHIGGAKATYPFSIWKLAAWIILLATLFNALTSHFGKTVIFSIPGKLPLVSGNVTMEAIVYGATNGLILTGMLTSFTVLNLALSVRDLIGLIPRAFFPVAVVTSIAVTYLPTTVRQFRQIREAQAVRGHQMRSLRDWLPLLMPLLVGGLEHAMQLAEAMTARGFLSTKSPPGEQHNPPHVAMLTGLILVISGWILLLAGALLVGRLFIVLGALIIFGELWYLGKRSPRTAYRRSKWVWQDYLSALVVALVLAICLLPLPGLDHQSFYYEPYPQLTLPSFNPFLGMALLGLLLPGILELRKTQNQEI